MKYYITIVLLIIFHLENFAQSIIISTRDCTPTMKVRSFLTAISNLDNIVVPNNISSYTLHRFVFDTKQKLYEQYLDNSISKDSVIRYLDSKSEKLSNQINRQTRNSINILLLPDKDSFLYVIPDLNFNLNFQDDIIRKFKKNGTDTFSVNLDYVSNAKIFSSSITLEISGILYNKEWRLLITNAFSKKADILIDNIKYQIEVAPGGLTDYYSMKNLRINFSQPDMPLEKIDFVKTLMFKPKTDTILSGQYRFVVDSVDFWGEKIKASYWKKANNRIGYREGDYIPNFKFKAINNKKVITITTYIGSSKYLLLDFWGTWCAPCIENFPLLKKLDQTIEREKLKTLGIACEYTIETNKVISILKKKNIKWTNFIVKNPPDNNGDILSFLKPASFPTYFLINKDLQILIRDSGKEGLNRIYDFLKHRERIDVNLF